MPSYSRRVQIPGKNAQELYEKVSKDIDKFLSKVPLGKFEVERKPADNVLLVKSSMFSATLSCSDSQIELDAKLSLMAAPFRSKLDEGISKWLSKTFNITVT